MPPVCPFDCGSERLAEVRDSAGQDRDLDIQQGVGARDRRTQHVMDGIHERGRIAIPVRRGTQVIFQSTAGSPANGSRSGDILQVDPRRRPLDAGIGDPCETQLAAQVVTAFVNAAADQQAAADTRSHCDAEWRCRNLGQRRMRLRPESPPWRRSRLRMAVRAGRRDAPPRPNPTRDGWFDRPGSGRPEGERSVAIPTPTPAGRTPESADRACVASTAKSIRPLRGACRGSASILRARISPDAESRSDRRFAPPRSSPTAAAHPPTTCPVIGPASDVLNVPACRGTS